LLSVLLALAYVLVNVRRATVDDEYWSPFGKQTSTEVQLENLSLDAHELTDLVTEAGSLHTLLFYKLRELKESSEEFEELRKRFEYERGEIEQLVGKVRHAY
jgi:hypothetical protein